MVLLSIAFALGLSLPVCSYIPASPTNSTRDAIAGGLNVTDISNLRLQWYSNGSYAEHVSYQLAGNGSDGISKGVLVHFSEDMTNNFTAPTSTPWIALVSCDKNATDASIQEDIFTLARDKGAVSALLYSLYSTACVINPEYSDPSTFDQVFDIFSTQSSTSSHLIEYQFGQLGSQNTSIYAYDSQQLNSSASDIQRSINVGAPVLPGYLLAILQAYNATGDVGPSNPGSAAGGAGQANTSSPNTALAMIILYAITGCVSALFCVVIITGAIRAIRHPERYGPRARMVGDGGPQSRAIGLTRAILDTFPIVKFGSSQATTYQHSSPVNSDKDVELQRHSGGVETKMEPVSTDPGFVTHERSVETTNVKSPEKPGAPRPLSPSVNDTSKNNPTAQSNDVGEGSSRVIGELVPQVVRDDLVPASIGRETCPICIVDFEEGDDIRVLPCEGKHCFHQNCVDPWLLRLSSSCPICRHDFLTLENMLSGHLDDEGENSDTYPPRGYGNAGRFSRYLRFAHRRRNARGEENDPTDPYMPTASDTPIFS